MAVIVMIMYIYMYMYSRNLVDQDPRSSNDENFDDLSSESALHRIDEPGAGRDLSSVRSSILEFILDGASKRARARVAPHPRPSRVPDPRALVAGVLLPARAARERTHARDPRVPTVPACPCAEPDSRTCAWRAVSVR